MLCYILMNNFHGGEPLGGWVAADRVAGGCGRLAACFRLDLPPRSQREGAMPKLRMSLKLYC